MWEQPLDLHLCIWKAGTLKFQLPSFPYCWCPPHLNGLTIWLSRRTRDVLAMVLKEPVPGKRRDNRGARIYSLNHFFTSPDHGIPHCSSITSEHGENTAAEQNSACIAIFICTGLAAGGVTGSFSTTPLMLFGSTSVFHVQHQLALLLLCWITSGRQQWIYP